jgi:hypothetical protein
MVAVVDGVCVFGHVARIVLEDFRDGVWFVGGWWKVGRGRGRVRSDWDSHLVLVGGSDARRYLAPAYNCNDYKQQRKRIIS